MLETSNLSIVDMSVFTKSAIAGRYLPLCGNTWSSPVPTLPQTWMPNLGTARVYFSVHGMREFEQLDLASLGTGKVL